MKVTQSALAVALMWFAAPVSPAQAGSISQVFVEGYADGGYYSFSDSGTAQASLNGGVSGYGAYSGFASTSGQVSTSNSSVSGGGQQGSVNAYSAAGWSDIVTVSYNPDLFYEWVTFTFAVSGQITTTTSNPDVFAYGSSTKYFSADWGWNVLGGPTVRWTSTLRRSRPIWLPHCPRPTILTGTVGHLLRSKTGIRSQESSKELPRMRRPTFRASWEPLVFTASSNAQASIDNFEDALLGSCSGSVTVLDPMTLVSITLGGVTPESLGLSVTFESGRASPNVQPAAVPEPAAFAPGNRPVRSGSVCEVRSSPPACVCTRLTRSRLHALD